MQEHSFLPEFDSLVTNPIFFWFFLINVCLGNVMVVCLFNVMETDMSSVVWIRNLAFLSICFG